MLQVTMSQKNTSLIESLKTSKHKKLKPKRLKITTQNSKI
jgi:hypothetical protein